MPFPPPPRNPALDPFRKRQWSESAFWPTAPRRKPVRFVPSGKVFVIHRDERRFAVVAPDFVQADNRISYLYP